MQPTAFALLASLLCAAAAPASPPPFIREGKPYIDQQVVPVELPPRPFRIAILPDRTTGRDWGLPYLEAAVRDLNRIEPDAVFNIGDMVQGYTRDAAEWERQLAQYQAITSKINAPFLPVPGNHDVNSGSREKGDRTFADLYLQRIAPLQYMAELDGASVIVMFSDEGLGDGVMQVSEGQRNFLQTSLDRAAKRGKPIMVLMHRPLWLSDNLKWWETIHPMLVKAGVDAVIAGHLHFLLDEPDRDGIKYLVVGTCGGSIDQHPLAGQLQHLTFVQIAPEGKLEIYHQPVGMTLPEDFVVHADQECVYKLRDNPGCLTLEGALPDSWNAKTPVSGTVTLKVKNPLDKTISITTSIARDPSPWIVDGEMFVSRTPVDAFNPFTTDAGTAWTLEAPASIVVPAKGSIEIPLTLKSAPTKDPRQPPTIECVVKMKDSKGRSVPTFIPLRPDIERTVNVSANPRKPAGKVPISSWKPSPFDSLENDPTVRFSSSGVNGQPIVLRIEVPDQIQSGYPQDKRDVEARRKNPAADAVDIRWEDAQGKAWCMVEPFTPWSESSRKEWKPVTRTGSLEGSPGWWLEVELPDSTRTVNVGVADNDQTYHTQWRWMVSEKRLAPLAASADR
ncbi:MAG: metallophosphoesterase [Planctomycetes bacterium]|nr:metallophosphoesterase [Planctomycetota bacterium]